ncbi:MAG: glutamate-5-semialdehyde dehydrogenase, partial [Rhodospirillaceae bacterium]|nr:glutamate-5-semialdehyde dehydrogenase [Rhodospirillaceae bacterium]
MIAVEKDAAGDLRQQMMSLGAAARAAARELARVDSGSKVRALRGAAAAMRSRVPAILEANARDMKAGRRKGLTAAMLDRLALDEQRVEATARGVESIADFDDPVGGVIAEWERPNGLRIQRVRVPLGVIGIIYESRPNVTADAGALCLKSGNAVILRGGTEAAHSNTAIHACLVEGLEAARLPAAAVQHVPTQDREAVGILLREMGEYVDVIVPRGGKGLIARVQQDARVPVMGHLEGICHTYVHESADLAKARKVVVNAKMRRTGICGATETLLVDRRAPSATLGALVGDLIGAGCEVRGDAAAR